MDFLLSASDSESLDPRTQLLLLLLVPAKPVVNVGPKLLRFIGDPIPHDLRAPDGHDVRETPVLCGMVGRGNSGGNRVACDLGRVELTPPGIGAGDNEPAERITGASPPSPTTRSGTS